MQQNNQNTSNGHKLRQAFIFHEDPAHGWLEVPIADIKALEIAEKISGFSYRAETTAYLEEDCDAPIFVEAYLKAGIIAGGRPEFWQHVERRYSEYAFVRDLPHYWY